MKKKGNAFGQDNKNHSQQEKSQTIYKSFVNELNKKKTCVCVCVLLCV